MKNFVTKLTIHVLEHIIAILVLDLCFAVISLL